MLTDNLKELAIFDTHLHLGFASSLFVKDSSDDVIITNLKENGVVKAIFSHHSALYTIELGLQKILKTLEKFDDFLHAYLVFNPNFEKRSLEIIKNYYNSKNIAGVKIHPSWHFCYPDDERYEKFWKFVDSNNIVVLTHTWNPNVPNKAQKFSDPFFFDKIVKKYASVKLILAHAGGVGEYLYKVVDLIEKNPNIYVDFAGGVFEPGLIELYVNMVGSERLLFGTDTPWVDVRFCISYILNSDISQKDKKNIFCLNASRLFNI
jgi:predicted TIM-barrel fold metal-dependent hydrolase